LSSKVAVLIDAENISYQELPKIIHHTARQGTIMLTAIYGNWQAPNLKNWHELATKHNFKIRKQTSGKTKNLTDMKLIMDAMEVLYRTQVHTFCLVANDADYAPLCEKIREAGRKIIGIGNRHAADTLIRACDEYIFIGNDKSLQTSLTSIVNNPEPAPVPAPPKKTAQPQKAQPPKNNKSAELKKLLTKAFAEGKPDADGWLSLSDLGSLLPKIETGFRPNNYGHATLSKLLKNLPDIIELRTKNKVQSAKLKK
jgi:uncharacterized protein (TIGR00288 family)